MTIGTFIRIGFAAFGLLACATGAASAATCSNASLKGIFAVTLSGAGSSGEAVASLYRLTADGNGKIAGGGVSSDNGVISTNTVAGTYTVAAACSGTLQITGGEKYFFILEDGNAQLQIVQAGTDNGIRSGSGRLLGAVTCNLAGLQGTFGAGNAMNGASPSASVGQTTYDGKGHLTSLGTIVNGKNVLKITSTGTYAVNTQCFVTAQVKFTVTLGAVVVTSGTAHARYLLANGGSKVLSIGTDAGSVGAFMFQK